jgi:hypothetical protein
MARDPHPADSSSAPWRSILLAVLGLWLARGALVLSQADVFGYEEFAKAELGRAMLDGLGIEHHRLAYHYYEVGGFVFSHLCALSFALFGDSLLAIKLVALGWHSAVLALSMRLAHAAYGRRGMAVAALVFVLPPASLQKLSLLALGIHFDALLFHAWILLHAGRIAVEGSLRRRDVLGLGLACGLGLSFNLTTLAASACAGLALLLRARRSLGARGWTQLFGAGLIGLLPWLWMAWHTGPAILDLHGETLGSGSGSGRTLERLAAFWGVLWNGRSLLDRADLLLRAALFAWGLVALLRDEGKGLGWTRLFLAQLALFVGATLASGLAVGRVAHYNEFARPSPTWLAIGLITAGGLGLALAHPGALRRWIARAAIALLACLGLRSLTLSLGQVPVSRWAESAATLAATSGCTYTECVVYLYDHLEGTPQERVEVLRRLRVPAPRRLEPAIAWAAYGRGDASLEEAVELARQYGGELWRAHVLGLCQMVLRDVGWDVERIPAALERFDGELRDLWFEACGRGTPQRQQLDVLELDIRFGLSEELPESWFVGLGWRLAQLHLVAVRGVPYHLIRPTHPGYDPVAAREFIERQPEQVRAALERGWREGREELRGSR